MGGGDTDTDPRFVRRRLEMNWIGRWNGKCQIEMRGKERERLVDSAQKSGAGDILQPWQITG